MEGSADHGSARPMEDKPRSKPDDRQDLKEETRTEGAKASDERAQFGGTRDPQNPRSPYKQRKGRHNSRPERPTPHKHSEPTSKLDNAEQGRRDIEQSEGAASVRTNPDRGGRGGKRKGRPGSSSRQGEVGEGGDADLQKADRCLKRADEESGGGRRSEHPGRYRYNRGYNNRDSRQESRRNYRHAKADGDGGKYNSMKHESTQGDGKRATAKSTKDTHTQDDALSNRDAAVVKSKSSGLSEDRRYDDPHERGGGSQSHDRDKNPSGRGGVRGQSRGSAKQQRRREEGNWRERDLIKSEPFSVQDKPSHDVKRPQEQAKTEKLKHDDSHSHTEPPKTDPKEASSDDLIRSHTRKKPPHYNPQQQQQQQQPHRGKSRANKKFVPTVQSDELSERLTACKYECTVCCDVVRAHEQVWSCSSCYLVFHLKCIKKWATAQVASLGEEGSPAEEGWRCPCCRHLSTLIPTVYRCYCGKVTNPRRPSRAELTVPHSCGGICLKGLATSPDSACNHKCRLPCHPGPCPPCPVTVRRGCPCGRTSYQVRCSKSGDLPSCGAACARQLSCGRHSCQELCHPGACPLCSAVLVQRCHCGRASRELCCAEAGEPSYCCEKTCNRELDCGNHLCELPCHKGECPSCDLLPAHVTTCPCGATPLSELLSDTEQRVSCLDPVPTCDKICGRILPCSTPDTSHTCPLLCHHGDCPPCGKTSVVWCNCGRTSSALPCVTVVRGEGGERVELRCQDICNKKKSCKRHRCNVRCCVDTEHVCELVCGKRLQCGQHYCQEPCHPGHCQQCWEFSYEELRCHCGAEVLYPPIPCGMRPPPCLRLCARLHPCAHPISHTCHPDSESCPPCTFLTEKMCMGGHELRRNIPCHISDVSCGVPCGKALPCGRHKCLRSCHKGQCLAEGASCKQPCKEKRKHCAHECSAPCHPDQPCRDTPCRAEVFISCKCGRRKEKTLCLACGSGAMQLAFQNFKLLSSDLSSKLSDLQSGQNVKINSVTLQQTPEARSIDCDEVCAQEARNRKLASALELDRAVISPLEPGETQYSPFLLEEARNDMLFVASVEKELRTLVETSQGSSGVSRSHSFRPMKGTQRRVIHELSIHYGCDTMSYDLEPIRNVIVSVKKNRARLPSVSLTKTMERGRSRPPPPPVSVMAVSGSDTAYDGKLKPGAVKDYFADDLEL